MVPGGGDKAQATGTLVPKCTVCGRRRVLSPLTDKPHPSSVYDSHIQPGTPYAPTRMTL